MPAKTSQGSGGSLASPFMIPNRSVMISEASANSIWPFQNLHILFAKTGPNIRKLSGKSSGSLDGILVDEKKILKVKNLFLIPEQGTLDLEKHSGGIGTLSENPFQCLHS